MTSLYVRVFLYSVFFFIFYSFSSLFNHQMTTELKNGINDRDFDGLSPLHYAAARGHGHVVTWLLDNGARFVVDKMGGTALHMAAAHGKLEVE
jgi:ankyrin repeat protein